jgi:DNA-binding NarL/FixJ family response regulator
MAPLSPRELEVIALMAEGLATKQIASRLKLSPATVKGYSETIYRKLGVGGRVPAVVSWLHDRERKGNH